MTKIFRVPRSSYTFVHYRKALNADTIQIVTSVGLHETSVVCETRYPSSYCQCWEFQLVWEGR